MTNPLNNYISGGPSPFTVKSLVADKVYGVVGVVDTVAQQKTTYSDPSTNQISTVTPLTLPPVNKITTYSNSYVLDDVVNTNFVYNLNFNKTTYVNQIDFDLSTVPLQWSLYYGPNTVDSALITTGIIEQYDISNLTHISQRLPQTYEFTTDYPLTLLVTKLPTGTTYGIEVANLLLKLNVREKSDLTTSTGSSISQIVETNRLNFVENFVPSGYYVNNITSSDPSLFWKSSPQPVGDAVVSFIVNLVSPSDTSSLVSLNRMYIDPLYTDTVFNLYYSYDASYWYPVQRDFRLRKGIYELPNIDARYLKFEFTQLTPEPYQLSEDTISRRIDVFPDWVDSYFSQLQDSIPDIANQSYAQTSQPVITTNYVTNITTPTLFGSAQTNMNTNWVSGSGNSLPDVTSLVTEPTVSYKTVNSQGAKGSVFKALTDVDFLLRRFPYPGSHVYKSLDIVQTWNHAYFTGIKQLLLFKNNYSVQIDYPEFTDYLLSSGTDSIITSGTGVTFSTPVYNGGYVTGGGYRGSTNGVVYTRALNTMTQYGSFKFGALGSDWRNFLDNNIITLQTPPTNPDDLTSLGFTLTNCTSNTYQAYNTYKIFTIDPTNSMGTSTIESPQGGGTNLFTTSEANFVVPSGWTSSTVGSVTTFSAVTPVTIPNNNVKSWDAAIGNQPYGGNTLGGGAQNPSINSGYYTLVYTASGSGSKVTPVVTYSTPASGVTYSGSTVTLTGSQYITFSGLQPANTTRVDFKIITSGTVTLSSGGFFLGLNPVYTAPLRTQGMRISGLARIYLPDSNTASYRCSLIGYTTTGTQVELARKQFSNLPIRTWIDLELAYTLTDTSVTYNSFTVKVTQTLTGTSENYRIALLGTFYNPITYEYSVDGSQWNYVIGGINDPNALINLASAGGMTSNVLYLRATFLADNTTLSAISVIPNYTQSPFYSTTPVQYIGDSKTNELSWRRAPNQRPLFQLGTQFYPAQYEIQELMGIYNSYEP